MIKNKIDEKGDVSTISHHLKVFDITRNVL